MQNKTRTFIAVDPPEEIIKEVNRIQNCLFQIKFSGKLTELENLHLTLKFLGEINSKTLSQVKHKLSSLIFPCFKAKLTQVGVFIYKSNPRIIWLKVDSSLIYKLQKQIDETLKNLFQREQRFMSHLTIARIKYIKDKPSFLNLIKSLKPKPLAFPINEIKLKSSRLTSAGPVYKTLKEIPLIAN